MNGILKNHERYHQSRKILIGALAEPSLFVTIQQMRQICVRAYAAKLNSLPLWIHNIRARDQNTFSKIRMLSDYLPSKLKRYLIRKIRYYLPRRPPFSK